jgi:hypothetical protein
MTGNYALIALACPMLVAAQTSPPVIAIPQCNDYKIQNDLKLNATQRACVWVGDLISPGAMFGAAVSSAYGQFTDDEPSWGYGTAGYIKRYGARYAQGLAKATGEYVTALAFGEDPRVRPSTCQSWKRIFCAARTMVAQPNGHGGYRPVISKFAGAAANGFVGMSFYPTSGTVNQSLRRGGTSLASSLLFVEFSEFEPDILHKLGSLFSPKSTPQQAGASMPARP